MSRRVRWIALWLFLLTAILTAEFVAIFNDEPGDTISENVWDLLSLSWLVWLVFAAIMLWLIVHLLLPRVRDWWHRKPWRS